MPTLITSSPRHHKPVIQAFTTHAIPHGAAAAIPHGHGRDFFPHSWNLETRIWEAEVGVVVGMKSGGRRK